MAPLSGWGKRRCPDEEKKEKRKNQRIEMKLIFAIALFLALAIAAPLPTVIRGHEFSDLWCIEVCLLFLFLSLKNQNKNKNLLSSSLSTESRWHIGSTALQFLRSTSGRK